jgi:tripartite-type tricarboxylate transporter receptor subunit TctC
VTSDNARALVQTGAERSPLLPEVPTLKEAGFPGQQVSSWFSLAAPAHTPPDVIEKLNVAVNKTIASSSFRELLLKQGAGVVGGTPADSAAHLAAEVSKWSKVIQESSIKTQ